MKLRDIAKTGILPLPEPKKKTNHIDTEDEGYKAGWTAYADRCYLYVQQRKWSLK